MNSTSVVLYFSLNFNITCFFELFINKLGTKFNSEKKYIYYLKYIFDKYSWKEKKKIWTLHFQILFFLNIIYT